jgi:hypothetical protein
MNQIATFVNERLGISTLVTKISKGYAVTFLDTEAEQIIAKTIYPHDMYEEAMSCAKNWANFN